MTRRLLATLLLVGSLGALAYGGFRVAWPRSLGEVRASLSISDLLGEGSVEGFARALEPRPFRFPSDHGPHPEFRSEWWYVTGNLKGSDGRTFGFQFTIFRNALGPAAPEGGSSWATNQVYMGHFALTEVSGGTFRAFERIARGAMGLAGAQADPFRVWVEDWVLEGPEPDPSRGAPAAHEIPPHGDSGGRSPSLEGGEIGAAESIFPLRLTAFQEDRGLSLVFRPEKPLVVQGDRGLSRKGPEPGNASFYFSFSRLGAEGLVTVGDEVVPVRGTAWVDREWSTSALSSQQVGWDWLALQLSDGRDLMYYQLRRRNGGADSLSRGILVEEDGSSRILTAETLELTVLDRWQSPRGGTPYPSRWRLSVPSEGLDLVITPLLADQELDLTFRYWEGAVGLFGTSGSRAVEGRGYVELTGYGDTIEPAGTRSIGPGITPH